MPAGQGRLPVGGPVDLRVPVSSDPAQRRAQLEGFYLRNPGVFQLSGTWDALKGATRLIPGIRDAVDLAAPTRFGYGEQILDQMRWQHTTSRQPHSEWWMKMNETLVSSQLTAEAYLRAGRASELTASHLQAWVGYLQLSDSIRQTLGLPPAPQIPAGIAAPSNDRAVADGALDPAAQGASISAKLTALQLRPLARRAFWTAHDATIQYAHGQLRDLLTKEGAVRPKEAEFGSAWANVVRYLPAPNPPAANRLARVVQRFLLPHGFVDSTPLSPAQSAFVKVLTRLDRTTA